MPRNKRTKPKREEKERTIYVLVFQKTNEIFVGKTTIKRLWDVYNYHFSERMPVTKTLFREYKEADTLPQMYVLSTIMGTDADALTHSIAWSRLFLENGFKLVLGETMLALIEDATPETWEVYDDVKTALIPDLLSPEKELFPNFGKAEKKRANNRSRGNDTYRVDLTLTKEEYEGFKAIAEREGISMTQLCKSGAKKCHVLKPDLMKVHEFTKTFDRFVKDQQDIIATILISGEYFPADMARMYEISQEVIGASEEVTKYIIKWCREIRKYNMW